MAGDLDGMEPVFGTASGKVEGRESTAFLPLVFRLHAPDHRHLAFAITDFHDNMWESTRSIEQLEDLRDEVGIGGSWDEFVRYIRGAFSSDNVTLVLGGPASAIGGHGATSGKIVALKSKGTPRISFSLTKLSGSSVNDRMADISVHLCRSWKALSASLGLEQTQASKLRASLEAEKLKSSMLEEQVDNLTTGGKKKRTTKAPESVVSTGSAAPAGSQLAEATTKTKGKARRVAPISSRMKRKGTVIGEEE